MKKILNKITSKFSNNFDKSEIESIILAGFLAIVTLVVIINVIKVYSDGQSNYVALQLETQNMNKLQNVNNKLTSQLKYVSSDEYKQLFLRDTVGLAKNNEQIFNTRSSPVYYKEIPDYLDLSQKATFSDWWSTLLK